MGSELSVRAEPQVVVDGLWRTFLVAMVAAAVTASSSRRLRCNVGVVVAALDADGLFLLKCPCIQGPNDRANDRHGHTIVAGQRQVRTPRRRRRRDLRAPPPIEGAPMRTTAGSHRPQRGAWPRRGFLFSFIRTLTAFSKFALTGANQGGTHPRGAIKILLAVHVAHRTERRAGGLGHIARQA